MIGEGYPWVGWLSNAGGSTRVFHWRVRDSTANTSATAAGSAWTNRIAGLTVTAPNTPATITQLRKNTATRPLSISNPHTRPAARKPLYKPWFAAMAAVLGVACGGDDTSTTECDDGSSACDGVSCDSVPKFGDLNFSACLSCHTSNAETRKAQGVPDDSDYTTYAGVSSRIKEIAIRVNDECESMPPNGSPELSDADKKAFTTWGCCGGPEK